MAGVVDSVWSARDTSPGAIDAALRRLVIEHTRTYLGTMPARALNLVSVVDAQWSGEIANRLSGVGRLAPSRNVVCQVEPGRQTLDARATVSGTEGGRDGVATLRETVVVSVGERHIEHLETIVDPLVVTDVATVVWSPHGHPEAVDALLPLTQAVLLDSHDEPDPTQALARVGRLAQGTHVVDLSWLRGAPWRERVAASFDPAARRAELATLDDVAVRHRVDSTVAALLLVGWLAARLGWRVSGLARRGDGMAGRARSRRGEVTVRLEPEADMAAPGLCGVALHSASGAGIALRRGAGGLRMVRTDRRGRERAWTVLGASRGEPGILGEGLRQALLRDRTFAPALQAARGMAG
ncbi:MAG TPA: glucose-6-phosphate dehydrogenase assembly protein OpcA [Solirubrobacteraceae bacterium]|nr:glucose-6-phosphate dehydrogenase assembly protein OpcA [Solirubrobacteraceae bacterium]